MMTVDVVVVGGGLVGACAALGLAQQGYDVVLLDPVTPEVRRGELGCDIRNVALNPQSRHLLSEVGVWDANLAVPYQAMQVWEESGTGCMTFDAQSLGLAELGWLVEMSPLQTTLYQTCQAKVTTLKASLEHLELKDEQVSINTSDGKTLMATFVVAADGAQSKVRAAVAVDVEHYPVHQHALATVVETEQPHSGVAYQRFLQSGPLALLPAPATEVAGVSRNLASIVWSQPQHLAEMHAAMDAAEFCAILTRASENVLGAIKRVDQRFCFPLQQQLAERFVCQERIALVGDAARVVHPLAGLGVNLGFEDVLALLQMTAGGTGLSHTRRRQRFMRERQTRSRHMIKLLELLQRTYAQGNPWFLMARNFATRGLNQMPLIKQQIMREAMGLGPISQV